MIEFLRFGVFFTILIRFRLMGSYLVHPLLFFCVSEFFKKIHEFGGLVVPTHCNSSL